jgi:hypothetical protein
MMNTSPRTNNAMAHEMITPPTLSLMTLPPEIRIQIYKFTFDGIDTLATLKFLVRGSHLPITTLVHGHTSWHMIEICSGVPPDCPGDKSEGAKHPSEVMLSLLMTSTRIQNEALPLALPDMKLCVEGVRGCRGWHAVIEAPTRLTHFKGKRPFSILNTPDCSCFPWAATLPPWKGKLLLKSLNTLTLSVNLFQSLKVTVTICFSGQISVDVSFPHSHESRMDKYTEIKYMNDRAIAKLKANTLRRVKFSQFANTELIDGVMDDLCNVGWHASREIDSDEYTSEITWYITAPHMSLQDEMKFGKAQKALKL